ncbi:MAG: peptide deformylase [Candidatus Kerfeldbacteria bacterium]|nr:peptide deformylase [Candidatus Kerfeldbacteria bacterium]
MSLRIYTIQEPEVRQESTPISVEELRQPAMQQFANDLIEAMIRFQGIGIASCQVGRTIRMVVITKEYTEEKEHLVLVNPRLVSVAEKTSVLEEGCLSVPGVFGPVERPSKVRVKALSRNGEPLDIKAKGMLARILQHEIDHINGILFVDKASTIRETQEEILTNV